MGKLAAVRTGWKQRNATAKEAHGAYQRLFCQSGGRQKMLLSPGYSHQRPFGNASQCLTSFLVSTFYPGCLRYCLKFFI